MPNVPPCPPFCHLWSFLWFQLVLDFKIEKIAKKYAILFEESLIQNWRPRIISFILNLYLYDLFVWLCRNNDLVAADKTNGHWVWQTQIVTQVLGKYYIIIIKDTKETECARWCALNFLLVIWFITSQMFYLYIIFYSCRFVTKVHHFIMVKNVFLSEIIGKK